MTGSGLVVGNTITGTATDPAGNTSQYGANATVVSAAIYTISGTVFHDVNADAAVSGGEGVFASVANAVKLYRDDGDGVIEMQKGC